MDVGLNSEQLALRDTVRAILRSECPPDVARQSLDDLQRWRTLWKTVVELGWTELAAPDATGEFGPVELALVLEECGAAIAPVPLLSSVGMAAGALRAVESSSNAGVEEVLADIAAGAVATLAVHAPGKRLPGAPMTLQNGRLRGRAVAVPNVSRADLIVTLAITDAGPVAAVVRIGAGVAISAGESTNPAQPGGDVEIDAVPVAVGVVESIEAALAAPLVAVAADLVGVASAALARSVEHAKTRRQFGTLIGAYQGIKHALADNYVSLERARSLTYAAAAHLSEPGRGDREGARGDREGGRGDREGGRGDREAGRGDREGGRSGSPLSGAAGSSGSPPLARAWTSAALAKAAAAEAAAACARTAVQVHGALGQTWEHDAHLYVRQAWQGAAMLGDSRALYHEVGRRFAQGAT
jgi:alkylation response protein AidB-like acyl-CoA dehydrogenase